MAQPTSISDTLKKNLENIPTLYIIQTLLTIKQSIYPLLPSHIRDYVHVCGYSNLNTLILGVPTGPYAAKIRPLTPSLIKAINQSLYKESIVIHDIKIVILPKERFDAPNRPFMQKPQETQPYQPNRNLVQCLIYLIKNNPKPEIQRRLKRILKRHLYNVDD